MKNSYKKFITPIYVFNMIVQSIVSLVSPIAIMLLIAWFIKSKTSVGPLIYVIFIMIGVFSGLYSMVTFILHTSRAIEAIEKQNEESEKQDSRT